VHFSSVITTSLALNYHENKEFEIDCMMCWLNVRYLIRSEKQKYYNDVPQS
jgi:hypothetical protein